MPADVGHHLERLQTADLIRQVRSTPDVEYWFKHAAIQEAVYGSLLKSTRAQLHRLVAGAIETSTPEGAGDRAAMLALHYERAGLLEQALKYAVLAGEQAQRTYALAEALEFFDRALAMAERLGDGRQARVIHTVYAHRGRVLQARGDHPAALANFQAMLRAAEETGDPALKADALNSLTTLQTLSGERLEVLESNLQQALELARAAGDPLLVGRTLWNLGLAHRFSDPSRAAPYLQQAYDLAQSRAGEDVRMQELAGYVLSDLGVVAGIGGRIRESIGYRQKAIAIFRALDHRPMLADALGGLGMIQVGAGEPEAARQAIEEGLAVSLAIGNEWAAAYNYLGFGRLHLDAGRFEEAIAVSRRALAIAQIVRFPPFLGMSNTHIALACFELGQVALGQASVGEAVAIVEAEQTPTPWRTMGKALLARAALEGGGAQAAWDLIGDSAQESEGGVTYLEAVASTIDSVMRAGLKLGHYEEIQSYCDGLLPQLESRGAWRYVGEARYWRGRLGLAQGDLAGAEADLLAARDTLAKAQASILLWQVDAALADLHEARGDRQQAGEARARAVAIVDGIAGAISNPELRRSFLGRPEVAALVSEHKGA